MDVAGGALRFSLVDGAGSPHSSDDEDMDGMARDFDCVRCESHWDIVLSCAAVNRCFC